MINFLLTILEYAVWWVPILMLSAPIVWTIIYWNWYVDYKERKETERWERISKFFAEEYPVGLARFWASPKGYDLMYKIKEAEFYEQA